MHTLLVSVKPHPMSNFIGWKAFVVSVPEFFMKKYQKKMVYKGPKYGWRTVDHFIGDKLAEALFSCSVIEKSENFAVEELEIALTNVCDMFNVDEFHIKKI